ncbi:MAG: aminoacyl-histidine dipeptidase [Porphyromonas sp.]|nr:aminoacyl-histidine dipeptidase [Porphyromonas sp.]
MINHEPKILFKYFDEITKVPRPSKKEEKIIAYIENFAKEHNLPFKKDAVGNILISKPATPGYEDRKSIVMQSHMDMVAEKNNDVDFDFDNDAIKTKVVDGWLMAEGTTLGADNGIGVATQLAILASDDIEHGPIECLFTVDEETGLTGAMALESGFFDSKILLNLDSEDEGELFIGCSGGRGTMAEFYYDKTYADPHLLYLEITVKGLRGGHSGGDIHVGLGNAVKILARTLYQLDAEVPFILASIDGGNLHNAIAREAHAIIGIDPNDKEDVAVFVNQFSAEVQNELHAVDPDVKITVSSTQKPEFTIDDETTARLINALIACPHGVLGMSHTIENLVETSNNLASVKMHNKEGEEVIFVETSQRSSTDSLIEMAANMVEATFTNAGAFVYERDGYPGWQPNTDSEILKIAKESYERLFNKEPKILAIHAGLECGLFKEKYPYLDMISFGPTMRDVHSPNERLDLHTVELWWKHLLDVLKHAPKEA